MVSKEELKIWVDALALYDAGDADRYESIKKFGELDPTAKIYFNQAIILAELDEHQTAIQHFTLALERDKYLAVAHFQRGVSHFLMHEFPYAYNDFTSALDLLTINPTNVKIDYEQIGLKFVLYKCEILFNLGLSLIYSGQFDAGMHQLELARGCQQLAEKPDHSVIDEAIKAEAAGYTVFSVPAGTLYRPSESKVKNMGIKNYLGESVLVAATSDGLPVPVGSSADAGHISVARPPRQQSAPPPKNGTRFPPTPPPDNPAQPAAFSSQAVGRAQSVREPPRPPRLDLSRQEAPFSTTVSQPIGGQLDMGPDYRRRAASAVPALNRANSAAASTRTHAHASYAGGGVGGFQPSARPSYSSFTRQPSYRQESYQGQPASGSGSGHLSTSTVRSIARQSSQRQYSQPEFPEEEEEEAYSGNEATQSPYRRHIPSQSRGSKLQSQVVIAPPPPAPAPAPVADAPETVIIKFRTDANSSWKTSFGYGTPFEDVVKSIADKFQARYRKDIHDATFVYFEADEQVELWDDGDYRLAVMDQFRANPQSSVTLFMGYKES